MNTPYNDLMENVVSKSLKDKLSLNEKEMKRRRFLLSKDLLTFNEKRELDILQIRNDLYTLEDLKTTIKKHI